MILARAPLRISFAGGGTDLPAFIQRHGYGQVVSATLDAWVYVGIKQRFEGDVRVSYSQTEIVATADKLEHPVLRACLRSTGAVAAVEAVTMADVPGRGTGLGSSGALAVAGLLAATTYQQLPIDTERLASAAAAIELGQGGGYQDGYAAAHGGLRWWSFGHLFRSEPVGCDVAALARHVLLVQLGAGRDAGALLRTQQAVIADGMHDADLLALRDDAAHAASALEAGDWRALGTLLREGWARKRRLPGVASDAADSAIRAALAAGAWGGKLCGAGGSGFLLFVAPPEAHKGIRRAVPGRYLNCGLTQRGAHVCYVG